MIKILTKMIQKKIINNHKIKIKKLLILMKVKKDNYQLYH